MKDLLQKGSILILLGTGGVGKTTVAAALGIAAAQRKLDAAVITVDPSRRLRDALGIARLGGHPMRLASRQLAAAGLDPSLRLSAMLLDVKGEWDSIVERVATDPAARKRILSNAFYQSLTAEFAGSEAFAALQQLYDLHQAGAFELKVVDTPPAPHAFDFLEAPARFVRLLDSRMARWLLTPSLSAGRIAMRIANRAAQYVVRELEHFAGGRVLSTIGEFFAAASEMIDAVVDRLRKTEALMRSNEVRFVLVTTAEEDRLARARELLDEMKRDRFGLAAVVINRFLDERAWREAAAAAGLGDLALIPRIQKDMRSNAELAPLADFFGEYRERTLDQIMRVAKFARDLPEGVRLAIAPEIKVGVRDLAALSRIAEFVTNGDGMAQALELAASRVRERDEEPRAHAKG